ncbi:MAG: hypothetical protein RLZZ511_3308 [Cyanobacteriota bacterium]|jgi:hypothetical protein
MDSRDRDIALADPTNDLSPTDLQALLTNLTPAVWQTSPWYQSSDSQPANRRQTTLEWLQHWCFLQSMGTSRARPQRVINDRQNGLSRSLTQNLHRANQGHGYWDDGWEIVQQLSDDCFQVVRNGLWVEVAPQHLPIRKRPYRVGDRVSIKLPKNLVVDDYYVAVGNAGLPQGACVELFFHLEAPAATPLIQNLTTTFNTAAKPLRLAMSHLQEAYPRRDVGILTITIDDYALAHTALAALYPELQPHLQPTVPLFSLPIAPGIGLLEVTAQPMQRYHCLAAALLRQHQAQPAAPTITALLEQLETQFTAAGFTRDYWHCRARTRRDYAPLN